MSKINLKEKKMKVLIPLFVWHGWNFVLVKREKKLEAEETQHPEMISEITRVIKGYLYQIKCM